MYGLIRVITRENHLLNCHVRRLFHVSTKRNMLITCHILKQTFTLPLSPPFFFASFLNYSFMCKKL